ncbi:hypothetical protein BHE74_00007252 [Ensete ventricosum]|nr:hypothetical protein GW17_00033093 [Ensete ventricosum]RWW84155.1 hypothetical protein BHE74_00007252 [Ensete ventricosum]RZR88890.1 hypothetical protein BHM03_00016539 [Ensete ventricosum]
MPMIGQPKKTTKERIDLERYRTAGMGPLGSEAGFPHPRVPLLLVVLLLENWAYNLIMTTYPLVQGSSEPALRLV